MDSSGELTSTGRMSWWSSWRLMVRLARRDARRHWGRTLLVALLVGLPTLVVSAGATILFTQDASPRETITRDMGASQALLRFDGSGSRMIQDGAGFIAGNLPGDPKAALFPGQRAQPTDGTGADIPSAASIEKVTGGHVVPRGRAELRVDLGERRPRASVLGIDGRDHAYRGMATLTSGRWPTADDEVLVSPRGERAGIPTSGDIDVSEGAKTRVLHVVGTATAQQDDLVGLPSATDASGEYLLDRPDPVTWADVQELNRYGGIVVSRYVLHHPDTAQTPAELGTDLSSGQDRLVITLLIAGLVLLTALMAGPAFTSGGARDRHALGQVGSNGATRAMLRRYVLARALVLGTFSSALAVLAGGALGFAAIKVIQAQRPDSEWGPLDLRWSYGAGLVLVGTVAAVVAALVPAIRASRTSLVQVLRGQVSPRRVRVGWPLLGLATAAVGGVVMIKVVRGTGGDHREVLVAVAAFALFAGAVMGLPWVMSTVGRAARWLPLSARIATRDVGRQRGRSVSGVTALLAVVALTTALAISGTSDGKQARLDYVPGAPLGYGYASGTPAAMNEMAAIVRKQAPNVTVEAVSTIGQPSVPAVETPAAGQTGTVAVPARTSGGDGDRPAVVVSQHGCTPVQILTGIEPCVAPSSTEFPNTIATMPAGLAQAYAGLSGSQRARLERGGALVLHIGAPYGKVSGSASPQESVTRLVSGTATYRDGTAQAFRPTQQVALDAIHVTPRMGSPLLQSGWGLIVTPETARRYGWPTTPSRLLVSAPGGLSAGLESAIADRAPDSASFSVERGPNDPVTQIIRLMVLAMGLIMLLVTLITAALTYAESRADQTTLASVGASGRTRRSIAACQAAVIGLVGGVVGLLVGVVPGVAATYPLTDAGPVTGAGMRSGTVLVIPWLELAGVVIGVPALAALLAAAAVRTRPPVLSRRLD
ncbi:FtsX-like permease family protein [Luteipulveratus flavus]|uniref:ABC3 transporter permease protein domain-containing protein n=1 Tax=Luteipulveratus flavus TaxID=3031728 RepID=A0ABT6CBY5_9MICO|nr:FtsX-like permease family protein [Luteipulveratus sp. YIM 133296]MDF8266423.1 hypothetical protein [Luteipulveratus sp. YIM 133296]